MSKEKFEVSKKEGEHFKLSQLEGAWVESFGMGTGIMWAVETIYFRKK